VSREWCNEDPGARLAAFVREQHGSVPWSKVKGWIATGKVFVNGAAERDPGRRLEVGDRVVLRMSAPRPRDREREILIVHEDSQVVVIDKPAGISSVPFEAHETGTAMDLIRQAWRRMGKKATVTPLHVVHRIDKTTSGLLMFAKTKSAERTVGAQFRDHSIERRYTCVAHGQVRKMRIESKLIRDRGDGYRGTSHDGRGKRAVTHVEPLESLGNRMTLCQVRLETGRTHQIRIHLAERGHPLVGEKVYIRDFEGAGNTPIVSPRALLHAATLAFVHPASGERLAFEAPLAPDFEAFLSKARNSSK
jgi:23S rRNA pseudouridine1911/1915/1917 synthase